MSGKPAARQGDMTQYRSSIIRFSRCRHRSPTSSLLGVPADDVRPSRSIRCSCKGPSGETDIALPAPLPFILSRTYSSYRTKHRHGGASRPRLEDAYYSCAITH